MSDLKDVANKTLERLEIEDKQKNTGEYCKARYREFMYATKKHRTLLKEYSKSIKNKQKEIDEQVLSVLKSFEKSRSFKAMKKARK